MDIELFNEFLDIINDKSIHKLEKENILSEKMDKLSQTEKRSLLTRLKEEKKLNTPYKENTSCIQDQKDKLCLLEIQNCRREYEQKLAFVQMAGFMQNYISKIKFENEEQKKGAEYMLDRLFGVHSDDYIGSIYDIFIKNSDPNKPVFDIPSLNTFSTENKGNIGITKENNKYYIVDYKSEYNNEGTEKSYNRVISLLPAYEQYLNAEKYCNSKLEEGRILVKFLFGLVPDKEYFVHNHGLFNSMKDINKYRLQNTDSLRDIAFPIPVGKDIIIDMFKSVKEGICLYDPADPEIELMCQGKHNIKKSEAKLLRKRMNKLNKSKIPKESLDKIREFRRTQDLISQKKDALSEVKDPELKGELLKDIEYANSQIELGINDIYDENLDEDEIVFSGHKIRGKGKKPVKVDYITKVLDS